MKKAGLFLFVMWVAASWVFASDDGPKSQPQAQVSVAQQGTENPQVGVLTLNDVIREGLEKNPAVQAAFHQVEAQKRRVPQVRTLPDPIVSVGWAGNITPFSVQNGDPSSSRAITVSQQLSISREVEAARRGGQQRSRSSELGLRSRSPSRCSGSENGLLRLLLSR